MIHKVNPIIDFICKNDIIVIEMAEGYTSIKEYTKKP